MEQLTFDQLGPALCACGCGKPTPAARFSDKRAGLIKGKPTRWIKGHGRRKRIDDGGRECGECGDYKPWDDFHISRTVKHGHVTTCKPCMAAKASEAWVNGGRAARQAATWQSVRVCDCGCGQPTGVSEHTDPRYGHVKGQPYPRKRNHWKRGKTFADPQVTRQRRLGASRARYAANPERARARSRAWQLANDYKKPPGTNLKSMYGITYADYCQMVAAQCGACAVCGTVPSEDPDANKQVNKLFVDHSHANGEIRGLLCSRCNLGIGYFSDSPHVMTSAITYLQSARRREVQ